MIELRDNQKFNLGDVVFTALHGDIAAEFEEKSAEVINTLLGIPKFRKLVDLAKDSRQHVRLRGHVTIRYGEERYVNINLIIPIGYYAAVYEDGYPSCLIVDIRNKGHMQNNYGLRIPESAEDLFRKAVEVYKRKDALSSKIRTVIWKASSYDAVIDAFPEAETAIRAFADEVSKAPIPLTDDDRALLDRLRFDLRMVQGDAPETNTAIPGNAGLTRDIIYSIIIRIVDRLVPARLYDDALREAVKRIADGVSPTMTRAMETFRRYPDFTIPQTDVVFRVKANVNGYKEKAEYSYPLPTPYAGFFPQNGKDAEPLTFSIKAKDGKPTFIECNAECNTDIDLPPDLRMSIELALGWALYRLKAIIALEPLWRATTIDNLKTLIPEASGIIDEVIANEEAIDG